MEIPLSNDYEKIVFETLKLPETDLEKYYIKIIYKYYESNSDITDCLINAIKHWINWYRSKINYSIAWESDADGSNSKRINPETTEIPLFGLIGVNNIRTHINKSYFENQITIIQKLEVIIKMRNGLIEYESQLPKHIQSDINKYPTPSLLDYNGLIKRSEIIENLVNKFVSSQEEEKMPKQELQQNKLTQPKQSAFPEIKPLFKPEYIQKLFDILKAFFSPEHQQKLIEILKTGNNSNQPLLFLDNGNRLAYAFRALIEADIIIGCKKKDLEKWISLNFEFIHQRKIKRFTPDYVEKCISRNFYPCKKPLFDVAKIKS